MTKQQTISEVIMDQVHDGVDVMDALRHVCGAALVEEMVDQVFETLNEQSTVKEESQ